MLDFIAGPAFWVVYVGCAAGLIGFELGWEAGRERGAENEQERMRNLTRTIVKKELMRIDVAYEDLFLRGDRRS